MTDEMHNAARRESRKLLPAHYPSLVSPSNFKTNDKNIIKRSSYPGLYDTVLERENSAVFDRARNNAIQTSQPNSSVLAEAQRYFYTRAESRLDSEDQFDFQKNILRLECDLIPDYPGHDQQLTTIWELFSKCSEPEAKAKLSQTRYVWTLNVPPLNNSLGNYAWVYKKWTQAPPNIIHMQLLHGVLGSWGHCYQWALGGLRRGGILRHSELQGHQQHAYAWRKFEEICGTPDTPKRDKLESMITQMEKAGLKDVVHSCRIISGDEASRGLRDHVRNRLQKHHTGDAFGSLVDQISMEAALYRDRDYLILYTVCGRKGASG